MWKLIVDNSSNTRNIKTPCGNICSNKYAIFIFTKAINGLHQGMKQEQNDPFFFSIKKEGNKMMMETKYNIQ